MLVIVNIYNTVYCIPIGRVVHANSKLLINWVFLVLLGSKFKMQSVTLLLPAHNPNSEKLSVNPFRVFALQLLKFTHTEIQLYIIYIYNSFFPV